ncbi:MAG: hypothetical protein R3F59_15655 [Myxococcota bacterium]
MVQGTPRVERKALRLEPITVWGFVGWAFLSFLTATLLGIALVTFAGGLPYYLTPIYQRPDHPMDALWASGKPYGLVLGIIGAGLMSVLLLYSVRKWIPILPMGSARFWMRFHLTAGLLGPLFIVLHSAFAPPSGFVGVGFWCMLLVAASGFFGRYLFGYLPPRRRGASSIWTPATSRSPSCAGAWSRRRPASATARKASARATSWPTPCASRATSTPRPTPCCSSWCSISRSGAAPIT